MKSGSLSWKPCSDTVISFSMCNITTFLGIESTLIFSFSNPKRKTRIIDATEITSFLDWITHMGLFFVQERTKRTPFSYCSDFESSCSAILIAYGDCDFTCAASAVKCDVF